MISWLTEPLRYPFMQTALLAVVLVGCTCALLGVYVVLRRMAFIGDALAHTVLPGLVIAYLQQWNLFAGAIVAGIATALGIGWLTQQDDVGEDTAIGILFTAMFALGILLMSRVNSFRDLSHILFGNILGVTPRDLVFFAVITLIIVVVLVLLHKELELTSADPLYAQGIGLSPALLRYILLVLLALAVVSGIQAVGVVLTSALLVTPAATASLLTHHLRQIMVLACLFAVTAGIIGLYLSFYFDVASGAAIVLMCTCFFGIAWLFRGG